MPILDPSGCPPADAAETTRTQDVANIHMRRGFKMSCLRMRAPLGTGIAVGLILVACSSGAVTSPNVQPTIATSIAPAETPAPSSPPTPTAEPTPDLVAIGQQYLKFSSDLVAAQAAANAALDKATNDKTAIAAYQQQVDAAARAIADLRAIDFPPEIQDERDAFVEALTIAKQINEQLVKDPNDPDPTIDTRLDAVVATVRAAGTAIRAALGLPPPQTPAPS
jgi:hypothetical protein